MLIKCQTFLSMLDCQDIYIGTKAARWGGPRIRIKSRRSTIQSWRLKIEHVQRIKVDRDDSPILVESTLGQQLSHLSPNSPACSQFAKVYPKNYESISKSISQSISKSVSKSTSKSIFKSISKRTSKNVSKIISKNISKFELSGQSSSSWATCLPIQLPALNMQKYFQKYSQENF